MTAVTTETSTPWSTSRTVTQVGGQVEAFLGHGLLIFFGAGSPAGAARHLRAARGDVGRRRSPTRRPDPARRQRAWRCSPWGPSSATTSSTWAISTSRPTAEPSPSCPATCASAWATSRCWRSVTPSASPVPRHRDQGEPPMSYRDRLQQRLDETGHAAARRPGRRRTDGHRASPPSSSGCRGSRSPPSSTYRRDRAVDALGQAGITPDRTPTTWTRRPGRSSAAAASRWPAIDDLGGLPLDIVVEATGVPDVGARVAVEALAVGQGRRHPERRVRRDDRRPTWPGSPRSPARSTPSAAATSRWRPRSWSTSPAT